MGHVEAPFATGDPLGIGRHHQTFLQTRAAGAQAPVALYDLEGHLGTGHRPSAVVHAHLQRLGQELARPGLLAVAPDGEEAEQLGEGREAGPAVGGLAVELLPRRVHHRQAAVMVMDTERRGLLQRLDRGIGGAHCEAPVVAGARNTIRGQFQRDLQAMLQRQGDTRARSRDDPAGIRLAQVCQ